MRGGVHRYAAQENPKIDTARAEKGTFRMETTYSMVSLSVSMQSEQFVVLEEDTVATAD